ncbi:epoxide hydrolase [Sodiomyces alkalinus F11]|uniref:Epoxide hydrolase n=1 Tax=Sodiomyces alkalinus (strain CBS 110278 / VKM F-3762 / F11) TaxID=1314773 RepID=A0A3N2Q154_SODAK|nr:epoxide hydrolase [Sodiomyces alkalinus F11]ROT40493.1 epoxide hydrolase [Sodiomyces alkalinus F11]
MMAPPTKLTPDDPRVERKTIEVRGKTYAYILGKPEGTDTPKDTVVLIHGFPDTSFGWRYQIPFFQSLGYQVIAPNMLGYEGTSCPEDLESFSLKSMSDDVAAICASLLGPETQIILGGHDWGGFLVWRLALWHPNLIRGVFSICTPYAPPTPRPIDLRALVESGRLPHWGYQLQLASGEVEEKLTTPEDIRRFLACVWLATGPNGEHGFSVEKGVLFDELPKMGESPVLSPEEMDEYVRAFTAGGLRGPLNWYRTKSIVFEEEKPLADKGPCKVAVPSLFVQATHDAALPASMSAGMEKHFEDLTTKSVVTTHWAMVMAPDEVNAILKDWIESKLYGEAKPSL